MKNKSIIIICGDPQSTFNEILIKSFKNKVLENVKFPIIIIGSERLFQNELKKFKTKISLKKFDNQNNLHKNNIYIFDIPLDNKNLSLEKKNSYIKKSFEIGLNFLKNNKSLALVNGPISKSSFLKGRHNGITEYLAYKTGSSNEVMLIFNKDLSVSPITTHIPINKITKKIKKKIIITKVRSINEFYRKLLGFKPNIAITGLNPHCETFTGKNVEKTEIIPAIKILKKKKIKVSGPFSADTIFLKKNRTKFDAILGMYHDQVLTPMKSLYEYDAINITLGLPFSRISPDHGPNEKMIGKNLSNPLSLIQAIRFLDKN